MRKSLAFVGSLTVAVLILGLVPACRNDLFVEPPPSVIGLYKGIYTVIEISNGIDTVDHRSQFIRFSFRSDQWDMTWDDEPTQAPPDDTASVNIQYFCDPEGSYELENGVILTIDDPNRFKKVCTLDDNPEGRFALDQSQVDSALIDLLGTGVYKPTPRLTQVTTDPTTGNEIQKTLRLAPLQ